MNVAVDVGGADPLSDIRISLTDAWIDPAAGPPGLGIQHCCAPDGSVTVRVLGDLDLSATRFTDCSGLGVVLHAARTSLARRWSFTLDRERSPSVARLIALAGVGPSLIDDRNP
jgi:hypothetical protein